MMNFKKTIKLSLVLIFIVGSILYLQRPSTVVNEETGQEIVLGPIEKKVALTVGNTAQDFILTDYEGRLHQLSDYLGQPVMVTFWATWCPFCVKELPLFEVVLKDYQTDGLQIIAINRGESLAEASAFTDPMNLTYPLLLDKADDLAEAYQVSAMPTTVFIDTKGVIKATKFGSITEAELRTKLDLIVETVQKTEPLKTASGKEDSSKAKLSDLLSTREIKVTEGVKHSVPLADIKGGGPAKDGIPSIDNPKFESVKKANKYLQDDSFGVAVSFNGLNRFYPNQITVWHEIVNDNLGGQPVLVSYCPLCGTGIVFEPIVQGEAVEFGTSGKLWNSNLVMYDRKTDSYWSQILGEAIMGELTGTSLKLLAHDNLKWKDWKKDNPDGQVLSRDTGSFRNYKNSPYGDYKFNKDIYFPVDYQDDSYHPKEPTWGIVINNVAKVYPQTELQTGSEKFTDIVGGIKLNIHFNQQKNTINIFRNDDSSEVVPFYGFWFSWVAVHPDTEVYTAHQ